MNSYLIEPVDDPPFRDSTLHSGSVTEGLCLYGECFWLNEECFTHQNGELEFIEKKIEPPELNPSANKDHRNKPSFPIAIANSLSVDHLNVIIPMRPSKAGFLVREEYALKMIESGFIARPIFLYEIEDRDAQDLLQLFDRYLSKRVDRHIAFALKNPNRLIAGWYLVDCLTFSEDKSSECDGKLFWGVRKEYEVPPYWNWNYMVENGIRAEPGRVGLILREDIYELLDLDQCEEFKKQYYVRKIDSEGNDLSLKQLKEDDSKFLKEWNARLSDKETHDDLPEGPDPEELITEQIEAWDSKVASLGPSQRLRLKAWSLKVSQLFKKRSDGRLNQLYEDVDPDIYDICMKTGFPQELLDLYEVANFAGDFYLDEVEIYSAALALNNCFYTYRKDTLIKHGYIEFGKIDYRVCCINLNQVSEEGCFPVGCMESGGSFANYNEQELAECFVELAPSLASYLEILYRSDVNNFGQE